MKKGLHFTIIFAIVILLAICVLFLVLRDNPNEEPNSENVQNENIETNNETPTEKESVEEHEQEEEPIAEEEPKQEEKPVVMEEPKQEEKPVVKEEPKQEEKPVVKETTNENSYKDPNAENTSEEEMLPESILNYNDKINEVLYIAGKKNDFAWVKDYDGGYVSLDKNGNVLGKISTYTTPHTQTTSKGYTLFDLNGIYTIVNKNGKTIFSEDSLGVTGFVLPQYNTSYQWYEQSAKAFEDGYLMAYKITESFNGVKYEIGIVNTEGKWVHQLSENHPIVTSGFKCSKTSISEEIYYAGDGIYTYRITWDTVGIYNAKNNTASTVNISDDIPFSAEEFHFSQEKMVWKTVWPYTTGYFYITPDGTKTTFLTKDNEKTQGVGHKDILIKEDYFWIDETLWQRKNMKALPASNNQLYFDSTYENGYKSSIIRNSEGTEWLAVENANGYKFEPLKLEYWANDLITDGNYFISTNQPYHYCKGYVYNIDGKLINTFNYNRNSKVTVSNGIIRIIENNKNIFFKVTENPDIDVGNIMD